MGKYPRLRDLREDHDLTQEQIGAYLNCGQKVYCNYERGVADVSADMLISLSKLYHTSVDYLLGMTDEKRPFKRRAVEMREVNPERKDVVIKKRSPLRNRQQQQAGESGSSK